MEDARKLSDDHQEKKEDVKKSGNAKDKPTKEGGEKGKKKEGGEEGEGGGKDKKEKKKKEKKKEKGVGAGAGGKEKKKDAGSLRQKLEKIEAKMEALRVKKEETLKLLKETEEAGATNPAGEEGGKERSS